MQSFICRLCFFIPLYISFIFTISVSVYLLLIPHHYHLFITYLFAPVCCLVFSLASLFFFFFSFRTTVSSVINLLTFFSRCNHVMIFSCLFPIYPTIYFSFVFLLVGIFIVSQRRNFIIVTYSLPSRCLRLPACLPACWPLQPLYLGINHTHVHLLSIFVRSPPFVALSDAHITLLHY